MRREEDAVRSVRRWLAGLLPEPWNIVGSLEAGKVPERPFALVEQLTAPLARGGRAQEITLPVTVMLYPEVGASRAAADERSRELRELLWRDVKWGPNPRRHTLDMLPLWSFVSRPERWRVWARATGGTLTLGVGAAVTDPFAHDAAAETVAAALAAAGLTGIGVALAAGGMWDLEFTALDGDRPDDPVVATSVDLVCAPGFGLPSVTSERVLAGQRAPWRTGRDWMRVESYGADTIRDDDDPRMHAIAVSLRLTYVRTAQVPSGPVMTRIWATSGNTGG